MKGEKKYYKDAFIIENDTIGLRQYTHDDDLDMFLCWQNIDTQKGYNGKFNQSFEDFSKFDINRFKFWVTVVDKNTYENVGTLRLGLDEKHPDLAIWIYPKYRNKGYGSGSFRLALKYIFSNFGYEKIFAGCYHDNKYSQQMLRKIGFARYPELDETEQNAFNGEMTIQMGFVIQEDEINEKF